MTLIVDASVAVKWVLLEPQRDRALALIGAETLAAPDVLRAEFVQVMARETRRGAFTPEDARLGLGLFDRVLIRLEPSTPLLDEAFAIALTLRASVYDSLYLALALREGAQVVTADQRFAEAALANPSYAGSIRLL